MSRTAARDAGPGPEPVNEADVLMVLPASRVASIEPAAVVVCLPGEPGGLRLRRGVYEFYRAFHLPRPVGEVLPADPARRAKVLDVVRLLAGKGYLVPPEVGIARLSGEPAPAGAPDVVSARA